jgi:hypothetical protein
VKLSCLLERETVGSACREFAIYRIQYTVTGSCNPTFLFEKLKFNLQVEISKCFFACVSDQVCHFKTESEDDADRSVLVLLRLLPHLFNATLTNYVPFCFYIVT